MKIKPENINYVCPFMMMANAIKGPDENGDDTVDISCIGRSCIMWCKSEIGACCGLSNEIFTRMDFKNWLTEE